jgi:hypothetical protein
MVDKKFLPDEPDDWFAKRDIDLTKHKVSKNEEWINRNISDPDFQRLFNTIKGFYQGPIHSGDVITIPSDLTPYLNRAMEKFKFSSKYEGLLYILTLKSCEVVGEIISGTMYDYAIDISLAGLSYQKIQYLMNSLFYDWHHDSKGLKEGSFEGLAKSTALSVASYVKYITGDLIVNPDLKGKFASSQYDPVHPYYEMPINVLHSFAVQWLEYFSGSSPKDVIEKYASLQKSKDELEASKDDLQKSKAKLEAKYEADATNYNQLIVSLKSALDEARELSSSLTRIKGEGDNRIKALEDENKALKDKYDHGVLFNLKRVFKWFKRRF